MSGYEVTPQATTTLDVVEKPTPAKSVVAGATALLAGLTQSAADGHVTVIEIVITILGAIIAAGTVWAVSNKPEALKS